MKNDAIYTLVENDVYVLKMVGELRFVYAPSVNMALSVIQDDGNIKDVIIDLTQTRFLDSTIIGTLLYFFLKEEVGTRFAANPPRIVTKSPDIVKSLVNIGVDMIFPIIQFDSKLNSLKNTYQEIKLMSEDKQTLEEYVKTSHRTLSKLNPRSDFKDIVSQIKH